MNKTPIVLHKSSSIRKRYASRIKSNHRYQQLLPLVALIIAFVLTPLFGAYAQNGNPENDEFATTIKVTGRYVEDTGIELRYFPEKRLVMEAGFREGFIIERSLAGQDDFAEIARLLPYDDVGWEDLMQEAEGEAFDLLDLARNYLEVALTPKGGTFDFETGISGLRQQRGDEDFEHAVFVLTAAREARVAEALAMSFTDENVIEGETYTYRVRTVSTPPIYNLVPEPFTIEASLDEHTFDNEVFFYEGDTWINFVWEEDEQLSLYEVERRNPGAQDFIRVTDAPRINLRGRDVNDFLRGSFRDEDLENYQIYTYRFYGHTVFGERILFAEVEAMPRDRTPPEAPRLLTLEHHAPQEVLLEWEMNDPPAPDLMGFVIGRAPKPDEGFEIIHPELLHENTRNFTDTTFIEGQLNYYIIQAVDTAFNVSSSIPAAVTLIDTIPPAKPVFISGNVDSLGVVTLEVEKNSEPDLMGYRLFKANDPTHEFSVIYEGFVDSDTLRQEIPTVFTDTITLNSLTPEVYYRVMALDFNFNQSDFSDIMEIERPDTIPPTTPVFTRVVNSTTSVELHFALSESIDVVAHSIYRNTSLEEPWEYYEDLDNDQNRFTDEDVEQGTTYYYSLRALDNAGLYSNFARPVRGKAYDDGIRPAPENLLVTTEEDTLTLSWEYPPEPADRFFVIFRVNEAGQVRQVTRTEDLRFTGDYNPDETYRFAIKAFTYDGGESPLSAIATP